jgi:predicted metalloprotease with PDZ domain
MKNLALLRLVFVCCAVAITIVSFGQEADLKYTIDLNDRTTDVFNITLEVNNLGDENNIYQFAATAPGTYQTMNLGRFVKNFKAFDKKGNEIPTEKLDVNQWKISTPKKVKKITYQVAETWDTPVEEFSIYKMCGTSIEDDHVLINAHCIFGYPTGLQAAPLSIALTYPESWEVGTALNKNESGAYYAKSYDHAVDSPILLGRLTKASTDLNGTSVEIYTYSKTDMIKSEQLMASMTEMLKAAGEFVVDFPVDRYAFLFHFEDETWGAWEHSYSSEYVYKEQPYTERFGARITNTAAHEFFHIITPLNIHSEVIQQFNFVTPTPSEHLWLYEGTTEWASDMMQLRYGSSSLERYFGELSTKLTNDSYYDPNYSLSQLAMNSFTKEGAAQYGNIYMRGGLVAGLLDIRLLELSGGKRGYREVILELSKKYGANNAFPEQEFFDIFVDMTYPEIADFFDKYVKHANPLPIDAYYAKLGIKYIPKSKTKKKAKDLGYELGAPDTKIRFVQLSPEIEDMGLQRNDELIAIHDTAIGIGNASEELRVLTRMAIGDAYEVTVRRGEEEIKVLLKMLSKEQIDHHRFEVNENATEAQHALRAIWMKNL